MRFSSALFLFSFHLNFFTVARLLLNAIAIDIVRAAIYFILALDASASVSHLSASLRQRFFFRRIYVSNWRTAQMHLHSNVAVISVNGVSYMCAVWHVAARARIHRLSRIDVQVYVFLFCPHASSWKRFLDFLHAKVEQYISICSSARLYDAVALQMNCLLRTCTTRDHPIVASHSDKIRN